MATTADLCTAYRTVNRTSYRALQWFCHASVDSTMTTANVAATVQQVLADDSRDAYNRWVKYVCVPCIVVYIMLAASSSHSVDVDIEGRAVSVSKVRPPR